MGRNGIQQINFTEQDTAPSNNKQAPQKQLRWIYALEAKVTFFSCWVFSLPFSFAEIGISTYI